MSTLQMALAVGAVVLLVVLWLVRRSSAADAPDEERIDTLIGWPPQPTRVLTSQERAAYVILTRALPDHMILAQVPVARFISVPKRNSYADWLRRLGYQCVDFLVCDSAAQVVAVVELSPTQASERARRRLARMTRTLQAAQIPLHTWAENALPSPDGARKAIAPAPAPAPAVVKKTTVAVAPVASGNPFEESHRDSTQDERIEMLEPPPSTWFDEFDTDNAPLNKH